MFNFFKKNYWVFLVLTVLISYGQIIWMQPWEDDNALFVKLAHLQDPVGYFGAGPFGEGVYKYAAVPFIPIFHFFGYNTIPYFALLISLYILTTLTIYKVFSYILGKTAGRVSAFIYAAGYVTSDSFWRMANSATTSISIIIISLFIGFYWKYFKERKTKWYFLALLLFFIAIQYAVSRDHYLVAIAIFFELIFLTFQKPFRSIFYSFIRLIPFGYIFLNFVFLSVDSRTGGVKDYITGILKGNLYLIYGFLSSISNLIIPDYLTNLIFKFDNRLTVFLQAPAHISKFILLLVPSIIIFLLLRKNEKRKLLMPLSYILFFGWITAAKHIFSVPVLNLGNHELFIATFGGIIILLSFLILIVLKRSKGIFALFMFWLLVNTAAYSSYFPTVAYDTINRYLAHSFFALSAVLGILYVALNQKSKFGKFAMVLILVYGVSNIFNAYTFQHKILLNRSYPVKNFYQSLKKDLPQIEKGDVLYFDVSRDSASVFRDAISAAMIPNSGSFGWRYNIDRYDFSLVTDFDELSKLIKEEKKDPEKIHSFWYSKAGLVETSDDVRKYFFNKQSISCDSNLLGQSKTLLSSTKLGTNWLQPDLETDFKTPLISSTPQIVELTLTAIPLLLDDASFPIYWGKSIPDASTPWRKDAQKNLSLEYKLANQEFVSESIFQVDSEWQDRIKKNLYDDDFDTVWQPDRVLWQDKNNFIKVKLSTAQKINKIVWVNSSYGESIPTSYEIDTSLDGIKWTQVKKVVESNFTGDANFQIIPFETISAAYVRMTVTNTLGGDAPMVAEFRVIPSSLSELNLVQAFSFIDSPFLYVSDQKTFTRTLQYFGYKGPARLYWFGNKENAWLTSKSSEFKIIYDGKPHTYRFILPSGGTEISKIKISDIKIPGNIFISHVKFN